MKKIYLLVVVVLGIVGISVFGIKGNASVEEIKSEGEEIVDYVGSHLHEFREAYNASEEDTLKAISVEGYSMAYIVDAEAYGVYIDFNDDAGYMVTTLELELYAMETSGDIAYLKDEDFVYYSVVDGFMYYDGFNYHKYEEIDDTEEIVYGYAGQSGSGEGKIDALSEYMADRYPSYKLDEVYNDILYSYQPTTMMRLSYYVHYISSDGGHTYSQVTSEANCALTACFNVMSSWQRMGHFPTLPDKATVRDIRTFIPDYDSNYMEYGMGRPGVGVISYWTTNLEYYLANMPELHFKCRDFAVDAEHYTPVSGLTTEQAMEVVACGTSYYKRMLYARSTKTFTDVMTYLQQGKAVFMGIQNSKSYGEAHAVALLGYYKYTYTSGVWVFAQTKTAYFYMIDDGQSGTVNYFDPNCNSKLSFEFIYAPAL